MPVNFHSQPPDPESLNVSRQRHFGSLKSGGLDRPAEKRAKTIATKTLIAPLKESQTVGGKRVKALKNTAKNSTIQKIVAYQEISRQSGKKVAQPDVHRAKMGLDLQRIGRRMADVSQEGTYYEIAKLGASANPVGRITDELFIPKKDLVALTEGSHVMKSKENLLKEIVQRTGKVFQSQPEEGQKYINEAFKHIVKEDKIRERRNVRSPNVQEFLGQIRERLEDNIDELSGKRKAACQALLEAYKNIDKGIDLSKVNPQIEKSAVLSNIRVAIENTKNDEEKQTLIQLRKDVDACRGDFIKKDVLTDLSPDNIGMMTRNCPEYMSSMEVMATNEYNPAIATGMEQIVKNKGAGDVGSLQNPAFADRPGYAYKRGNENHREVLAGNIGDLLGVQKFLTPKLESKLTKGKLGSETSPRGLASKWLAEGTPLNHQAFFRFTKKQNQVFQKESKGEAVTEQERTELEELKKAIAPENDPGAPGPLSVNMQAWLDLATCSYDSHANQYMIIDGEAHCYDFARFCAPSEAYRDEEMLMLTLRSTFIDHPFCEEDMPEEAIHSILDVDVDQLEQNLAERGLLENQSFFDDHAQNIRQAVSDYHSIRDGSISKERFAELMERHGYTEDMGRSDVFVTKAILNEYNQLKEESFSKIHPKALRGMTERIRLGQEYIRSCRKENVAPTMKSAFKAMMPAQATLHRLFAKYTGEDPGNRMAIENVGGAIAPLNLVAWLEKTKNQMSPEDLKEAQNAIETLKEKSCDISELCTTMDIGDN